MHNISCSFVVNAFTHNLNVIHDCVVTQTLSIHKPTVRGGNWLRSNYITFDLLWMAKHRVKVRIS